MKNFLLIFLMLFLLVGCSEDVSTNQPTDDVNKEEIKNDTEVIDNSSKDLSSDLKTTDTSGTTDLIPVELVSVIDGDTIKVIYNGEEKNVRYLLIDTPETRHPRLGKQPFGQEAKELNSSLVSTGELSLEFDVGERVDKYGRLLAYVYVDGKNVNESLVRSGLARVGYIYPPSTRHLDLLKEAEKLAKSEKLGIWSIEDYTSDSGFNSEEKEEKEPEVSTDPVVPSSGSGTVYANCTELRVDYPSGVPEGHEAYQGKMDRDKDGFACEK